LEGELMDKVTRSDMVDIERAVVGGWQLPADLERTLPEKLAQLALTGKDQRVAVRAAAVLLKMREANEPKDGFQADYGTVCVYLPSNGRESTT
jgi:hypothetical protein